MRVLIVNVNARTGSTGKITMGLYTFLKQHGHDVKVCYRAAKEELVSNPDFIPLTTRLQLEVAVLGTRLTGKESHFSPFSTKKLENVVESFKPDLVQLYNIHGDYINAYSFLEYLKKKGIPVVYSMLDEFPYMGKCPYPIDCVKFMTECNQCPQKKEYPRSWLVDRSNYLFWKKYHIYQGFPKIVFTGPPFVCERAKSSFLLKEKCVLPLDEPFDFDSIFYPRDSNILRKELGILPEEKVVLTASGTSFRKGGKFFLELARVMEKEENVKFIFLGYDRHDWIFPGNVIVKGYIASQDLLAEYMSLADLYVCTSVGDSTPSVCLCSIGCGTPLAGFDYGGVKDVAPNEFGHWVEYGNVEALANVVRCIKKKEYDKAGRVRTYAKERFSPSVVYGKQMNLYNSLLKNDNTFSFDK